MADVKSYIVKAGDTLSEIAQAFKSQYGYSDTYKFTDYLAELNDITDPDYIVVGQTIQLNGTATVTKTNTTSRATIKVFGLQSNTDRTVYATWTWDKSNTENYQTMWYYDTGDGVWFVGSDSTVEYKQATYSAPSNATKVKFKVKPISKKRTVNNKETSYWTASWSTEQTYSFANNPPTTPSVPKVEVENYKLTAELDNLDVNGSHIEFQVVKDNKSVCAKGKSAIKTGHASYSCTITAGSEYKVRCRSVRGTLYSDWTEYTENYGTIPSTPDNITKCRANSETSVYLEWTAVSQATSYDLEYTTELRYFDGSDGVNSVNSIEFTHYEKTGLTSGDEYFFRVRAVNAEGHSGWSPIKSIIIGEPPVAPTTWSSTTTAIVGEPLNLYWTHNSKDASSQTYAELELYINGTTNTYTIKNTEDEDEKDKTSVYAINTSSYTEGSIIKWRVRTAGITKVYGDWSIQRTIDVYAPPTLELSVTDQNGIMLETLTTFPFRVSALAGPSTQVPIGYNVVITANETYETVDNMGNPVTINSGDQVYSKYFDISSELLINLSASNISLENNISYTVTCFVSMNSGLTAEASSGFIVSWTEEEFEPNAEIGVDEESYTAYIRPFCEDADGNLIEGILLSVYRREFDGSFTELARDLDNVSETFVTDPHPALDYARYRIVATTVATGTVSYYDVPGYPVGGIAVIIQWNEDWSTFDSTEESELAQPTWSGSLLKLPYNIDVSDSNKPDTALIEYIGRKHPVSYYGTQLGSTSTWNMVIPKSDKDTLYALRRLSTYMGDVYVREPSGSGYWANITVSFSQKHLDVLIPITLNITRVSGGA